MSSPDQDHDTAKLAIRVLVSVHRFRSRLREEAGITSSGFTLTQLALLGRLITDGPATAAALAADQHVSQQAIAQNLAGMKSAGLIAATRHPTDRRKVLIEVTEAGRDLYRSMERSRDAWLVRAIDATMEPADRAALAAAAGLLDRLAKADLRSGIEFRLAHPSGPNQSATRATWIVIHLNRRYVKVDNKVGRVVHRGC